MSPTKLLITLLCIGFFGARAQQHQTVPAHNHEEERDEFRLPLEFDKDSLKGFDEEAAWQQAKMNADVLWKQQRIVAVLKRNYIDFKYGYLVAAPLPEVQGPCTNPDFENGTISGWSATQGPNQNSLTMAGCCPAVTSQAVIVSPGVDPNIGALQMVPAGGGNFACRLGPTGSSSGGTSYRLAQTFTVTPANSVFIYKYAVVLNKAGHICSEQPFFNVSFKDCSGNQIPCGQYNVTAIGSLCSVGGDPSFVTSGVWAYKDWTTAAFDLTPYIGQCVTLEFTVAGCVTSQGAHGGYAYIDASCQPFSMTLNGVQIPVGQTNSSFCGGVTTNTLCAPPGFTYNWTGPGVTGQTTQCITTTADGTYSVTLGVPGAACLFNPVLYSNFSSTPNPTVTASITQPVCALPAGTATMNVTGGTGPYTYSWSPAAPSTSVNTNLPNGGTNTVTVIDSNGCIDTTIFTIDVYPPAPQYTLSTVPGLILSCNTPTINLTFAPTNTNTTTYWQGPVGTIVTTDTIINSPGVYTYTTINTVSTCSLTGTINITSISAMPVANYSYTCNGNQVGLSATSTPGVLLDWLEPGTGNSLGNPTTSTAVGIFTLTATDPINGCVKTQTVSSSVPTISVSLSPSNGIITCTSPTIQATATSDASNVTFTWNNGATTFTGTPFPITSNGTYTATVAAPGGCSSQTVITITTNTTVNVSITSPSTVIPCSTGSLALTANSTGGGTYTYAWSPSSPVFTGNTYQVTNPGTYAVVALNTVNGCTATANQTVSQETVNASFTASPYSGLMPLSVTFTNTSYNATSYYWDLGNGNTAITTNAATVYNWQGDYTVVLVATKGVCQDTAVRMIHVDLVSFFTVPNVFTPNGDGKNDVFTFDAINMGEITFTVFDRWGLKMFDTTASGNVVWDGKNKGGAVVADGTYFYLIVAKGLDGKDYNLQGTINVFK